MEFNPEKHFLGKLCLLEHEHMNTGLSIRGLSSKGCMACESLRVKNFKKYKSEYDKAYRAKNKLRDDPKKKEYRAKNQARFAAKTRRWSRNNKDRKRLADKEYKKLNKDKMDEYFKVKQQSDRDLLRDPYLKLLIRQQLGVYKDTVTPELIELKREQLTVHRLIREIKNGAT